MFTLFLRTVSQGLQAFVPVAAAWTWFRRSDPRLASSIGIGALLSIPATMLASRLFAGTTRRALDEALLAGAALLISVAFLTWMRHPRSGPIDRDPAPGTMGTRATRATSRTLGMAVDVAVAAATLLIVVRQTMEMGATFAAAFFELQSLEATRAVLSGALVALAAAFAWLWVGRRVSMPRLARATRCLGVVFLLQMLIYALHEGSEAGLVPFSEAFHEVSEPYGPDGIYGMYFSELLVIAPLVAAAFAPTPLHRAVGLLLSMGFLGVTAPGATAPVAAASQETAALQRQPHVLFRDTTPGSTFGTLSVAPLATPEATRVSTGLSCDRIAFVRKVPGNASPGGICLHAEGTFFGLFKGYWATLLDESLKARGARVKLEGKPSRSRVAAIGTVGAYTVFVFGDGYSTDFSTRTHVIDLRSGTPIAELESFTTYRNGEKFSARDFNFWGVTFSADGDTVYASLRTAGQTYLVRGAVGARTFTVLRENVECPSLSPDGRRLAFKKFVGPDPGAWRIAVLDLATMQERVIGGETRYIDDQMEWLDDHQLLYGVPRRTTSSADVWVVSVDGGAPARVFLPLAESPIVVR